PPDVAVIVAVPGTSPVTVPFCDTTAMSALLVDHATGAPAIVPPLTSRTVAVRGAVAATLSVTADGFTLTLPTGGAATVTATVPILPSLVAVTEVLPGATAVMRPVGDTVAT